MSRKLKLALAATAAFVMGVVPMTWSTAVAQPAGAAAGPVPLTLDQLTRDWDLNSVVISPDGKHIAGIAGRRDGLPIIKIWKTDDLSATPVAIASSRMYFRSIQFVKNDRIWITANQPVSRGTESRWLSVVALTDLTGSQFETPLATTGSTARVALFNRLAGDPDNVLLTYASDDFTIDLVKYNVRTGREQRMARGGDLEDYTLADVDGELRVKSRLFARDGTWFQEFSYKRADGTWVVLDSLTRDIENRINFNFLQLSRDGNKAWVSTDLGTNFRRIHEFDFATQTLSAPLFENTEFDASRIVFWSPGEENEATLGAENIAGFCYDGPAEECIYTNPQLARIQERMERALPGRFIRISPRQGTQTVLVRATGPEFPTTWYLLRNETQLTRIGSVLEGANPQNLGTATWETFTARDGMQIPAIVYLPPGYNQARDGRLPLVVMPHGGPWARDDMEYDISHWSQMFATRGFAVIQPQYRGSEGLGRNLWLAGDREWGAKMQDDKDDSARWLVERGIVDPDRMMMYGYSYGGFAASAAAARSGSASKGLWQCAISGAPVIDMDRLRENEWGANRISRKFQGQTVRGWNPQANLGDVEIPWLIFHGDFDRQADTVYSRSAAARMRALGKQNFEYVELPRMAHTLAEMTVDHRRTFIPLILNWLDNNCGNISVSFTEPDPEVAREMRRINRERR